MRVIMKSGIGSDRISVLAVVQRVGDDEWPRIQ